MNVKPNWRLQVICRRDMIEKFAAAPDENLRVVESYFRFYLRAKQQTRYSAGRIRGGIGSTDSSYCQRCHSLWRRIWHGGENVAGLSHLAMRIVSASRN